MQDGYRSICMPWPSFHNCTQNIYKFKAGHLTVQKIIHSNSTRPSTWAMQCPYQGWWGGAVGLMDNPSALGCWMVAGPEVARLIKELEASMHPNSGQIRHHDTTLSAQKAFAKDVRSILAVTKDLGDPFEEDSLDLQVLDTKDTSTVVIETVSTAKLVGQEQFQTYSIDCSFVEPRP